MARPFRLHAPVVLFLAFVASAHAQNIGYSYVRMSVNGHAVTNLVWDHKHTGWMRVLGVEARLHVAHKRADGTTSHAAAWAIHTLGSGRTLLVFPKSGQGGRGELWFAAGDDGEGLGPLLDAQKQKIKIPTAEPELYSEDANRFIGRFDIKDIRVLSLEDVQSSACPEFLVKLSFESIARQK